MAFKDIMIHLDNSPGCAARLDLAVKLARVHGAHLRGLFYYAFRLSISEAETAKVKAVFLEKTSAAGISADWLYADWSASGVTITDILTLHSYYTDLVIIGQPDPADANRLTREDLPEQLALGAGCPLLVVPYAGTFDTAGERVMVAWKGARVSARAIHDAMPILEKAKYVGIVTVGPPVSPESAPGSESALMNAYLARHGVTTGYEQILATPGFPVGDFLLNHACDQKMDLLVMGGHVRNRRGALVLGPVFAHLLSNMTLPVLLSC